MSQEYTAAGLIYGRALPNLLDRIMAGRASKRRRARCFLNGMRVAQVIKRCCIVMPIGPQPRIVLDWHNFARFVHLEGGGLLSFGGCEDFIIINGGWSGSQGLTDEGRFLFGFLQIRYKHLVFFGYF